MNIIEKRLKKTADANWYIDLYEKIGFDNYPQYYKEDFSTEKWVKNNVELLSKALNMTPEEVTSKETIEKIDNGFTVSSCYDTYSDCYKDAHGFRWRPSYLPA